MTFAQALDFARQKRVLPTSLGSADLRALGADLKRRAFFSARLMLADVLQVAKTQVELIAGGLQDEYGRYGSIAEAKAQLKEALRAKGYQAQEGEAGTIKDFMSDARRQLIVETNVLDTMNYGRWKVGQDQDMLDINPAWELVRMTDPKGAPRDWSVRWAAAGGRTFGGRMIAPKNDAIWQALGNGAGGYDDTLGNPWPPFAFNSGMSTIDVPRDECIELGVISEDQRIKPQDLGLNENMEASADRFDGAMQTALSDFDGLQLRDGALTLKANARALLNILQEAA